MRGGGKNLQFSADTAFAEWDRWRPLVSTSKTLCIFSRRSSGILWRLILFYWAFFETVAKSRTDEICGWSLRLNSAWWCTAVARSPLR